MKMFRIINRHAPPPDRVSRAQAIRNRRVSLIAMSAMSSSKGTSLADRFKALQTAVTAELQDPEAMSLEELSMMKITFGEAKRGQTYRAKSCRQIQSMSAGSSAAIRTVPSQPTNRS